MRVENHAVTDHRKLSRPDHTRWQQGQLIGLAVNHQRMAGIMAALKTDHDVGLLGEPIDDLAFALVAPLRANHDDICHEEASSNGRSRLGWYGFRLQPLVPIMDDALRSKKNWLPDSAGGSRQ